MTAVLGEQARSCRGSSARGNPVLEFKAEWDKRPLHFAVQRGHVDIARILLEASADVGGRRISLGSDGGASTYEVETEMTSFTKYHRTSLGSSLSKERIEATKREFAESMKKPCRILRFASQG